MSLRIREDGPILCAAMHPAVAGDTYLHDGLSYKLCVELRAIVTEPMDSDVGRGGHARHGQWWWADEIPDDVVIEKWPSGEEGLHLSREEAHDLLRGGPLHQAAKDKLCRFLAEEGEDCG